MAGSPNNSRGAGFVDTYNKLPIDVNYWLEEQENVIVMSEKQKQLKDGEHAQISKSIGWQK